MIISYRLGVFETNSSSVHTFSIKPVDGAVYTPGERIDLVILGTGQFGWGIDKIDNWMDKADYLYQLADNFQDNILKEKIEKILKEAGVKEIKFENTGYVDDAPTRKRVIDLMKESDSNIKGFIFGNSFILINNDSNDFVDQWREEGLSFYEDDGVPELEENKYLFSI